MSRYYHVKFSDCSDVHRGLGGILSVKKEKLSKKDVVIGMQVLARWSVNDQYYEGRIEEISDAKIVLDPEELMPKTPQEKNRDTKVLCFCFFPRPLVPPLGVMFFSSPCRRRRLLVPS